MRANEQALIASIPTQLSEQDRKIRALELRIIALESKQQIPTFIPPKKVDGRTTRWQK